MKTPNRDAEKLGVLFDLPKSEIAGPQGSISSRTTVKDWLGMNPTYDVDRWGQPIAFGCDICQALRFETLEEAIAHRTEENKTIRSRYWMHDVTMVCQRRFYVADVAEIRKAAEKQESE